LAARFAQAPRFGSAAGDRNPWLVAIVVSTAIANVSLRYIAGSLAASVEAIEAKCLTDQISCNSAGDGSSAGSV
jgi:hypothetical protein